MKDKNAYQFIKGRDFYIENGLYVFTEYYLKQRGYCCKNKCRHCPYGYTSEVSTPDESVKTNVIDSNIRN